MKKWIVVAAVLSMMTAAAYAQKVSVDSVPDSSFFNELNRNYSSSPKQVIERTVD